MDRRSFLKRIAAVAAGAVAVPVAAKKLPWTQYSVTYKYGIDKAKGRHATVTMYDEFAEVDRYSVLPCLHETHGGELGDRITCRSCGRQYTFIKMEAVC